MVDEGLEAGVAGVELVVADGHCIEADAVHQRGIGLAFAEGVVERAGDGVAGVQLEDVVVARGELGDRRGDAREAAELDRHARAGVAAAGAQAQAGVGFVEVGVVVVDVEDGQAVVGLGRIGLDRAGRRGLGIGLGIVGGRVGAAGERDRTGEQEQRGELGMTHGSLGSVWGNEPRIASRG